MASGSGDGKSAANKPTEAGSGSGSAAAAPIPISAVPLPAVGERTCYVLRGISGSGKSSLTKHLVAAAEANAKSKSKPTDGKDAAPTTTTTTGSGSGGSTAPPAANAVICSADLFFSQSGQYRFDPRKLGEAHAFSLSCVIDAFAASVPVVVVDNTASKKWEYVNYCKLAKAMGYKLHVLEISCPDESTALYFNSRNAHNVPAAGALGMWRDWQFDPSAILVQPFIPEGALAKFIASNAAASQAGAPAPSHSHSHGGGHGGGGNRTPPRARTPPKHS